MKGDMTDNNENKETLTFAKIWEDFIDTTGFHAVNKISFGRKHSIHRTIFWVTLWLLSAGYLLFIVSTELTYYYQYPTTITVTGRMSEELEFPAITICNIGSRNKSMFSNDTRTSNYYRRLSGIADLDKNINWTDPFYVTEGYFKERTIEDLYAESKDISRFIRFQQFDLIYSAFTFTPVATDIGLCIRGNVNNTLTTSLHGGLYNLHMYLDLLLDDDYYTTGYLSSGIKVVVHDQHEEMLMVDQGFVVPPASEAFVEISKKQYKYLPAPYQAFENDICQQKDPEYSKSKCKIDCMRKKILNSCNCVDFMFDSDNGTYCSKEQYMQCHTRVYWEMLQSGSNYCDCPLKCEYTVYETSLSMGKFPSAFISKDLNKMLKETEEYIKKNFISLRVYFKDLQTTVTEQKPKYENVGDVFSNVGGQMGLFLGASILTVTELIEFMLFVIWYMCVYLTRRNVMVYTGNVTKHVQVVKR